MTPAKIITQKNTANKGEHERSIRFRLLLYLSVIFFLLIGGSTLALLKTQQQNMQHFTQHLVTDASNSLRFSLKRQARALASIGDTLLRLHKPEKYGDFIDRYTAREAEHSGKTLIGLRTRYSVTIL